MRPMIFYNQNKPMPYTFSVRNTNNIFYYQINKNKASSPIKYYGSFNFLLEEEIEYRFL